MRLFIVGRLINDKGRIEAYKIYEADKKQLGLYSRDNVHDVVRRGILVVGLMKKLNSEGNVARNSDGKIKVVENRHLYSTVKTDDVNSKGEPLEQSEKVCLIGLNGFCEDTKYRVVDSMGHEKWLEHRDFENLVDQNKVVGALRTGKNISIYKHCKYQQTIH